MSELRSQSSDLCGHESRNGAAFSSNLESMYPQKMVTLWAFLSAYFPIGAASVDWEAWENEGNGEKPKLPLPPQSFQPKKLGTRGNLFSGGDDFRR